LVGLSLINSITNIGILVIINNAVSGKRIEFLKHYDSLAFAMLIVISFISTRFFQNYLAKLTNDVMFNAELSIIQKLRNTSFESFERFGHNKIYSAINDTHVLSRVPEMLVSIVGSSVSIVCALCYLLWVSPVGMVVVLSVMALLLMRHVYVNKKIVKELNVIRKLQDRYYAFLADLIYGFKQIKTSGLRNDRLYNEYIYTNKAESKELSVATSKKYIFNQLAGSFSWYCVLGVVIFLLPRFIVLDHRQIGVFITTILFLMSPISTLIGAVPFYGSVKIAAQRLEEIDKALQEEGSKQVVNNGMLKEFSTIRFEQVRYKYRDAERSLFELFIDDLTITGGEVLFITGGNGSGKTTFINLLTGLYKPLSGKVYLDEREVSWDEFGSYCNDQAIIYTDHKLFRHNYDGFDLTQDKAVIESFKDLFRLNNVLDIDYNTNTISPKLSKGQQKRLALLLAVLERKSVFILDEWAAEQDPVSRKLFYTEWLKELRNMNKTMIVISHDDDFYYTADRVIKFRNGSIFSEVVDSSKPL
jgi:ABC-type siderophore export system fused ATPase/permease subunit